MASTANQASFIRTDQAEAISVGQIQPKEEASLIGDTSLKNTTKHKSKDQDWSIKDANYLYGIKNWGSSYFSINKKGQVVVHPKRDYPEQQVALYDLISDLKEKGYSHSYIDTFYGYC